MLGFVQPCDWRVPFWHLIETARFLKLRSSHNLWFLWGFLDFGHQPILLSGFRVLTALSICGDRAEQGFHFQFSISEEARPAGMRTGYG